MATCNQVLLLFAGPDPAMPYTILEKWDKDGHRTEDPWIENVVYAHQWKNTTTFQYESWKCLCLCNVSTQCRFVVGYQGHAGKAWLVARSNLGNSILGFAYLKSRKPLNLAAANEMMDGYDVTDKKLREKIAVRINKKAARRKAHVQ